MKKLLIIGGSKFVGRSFVNYFTFEKKYKNLKIIIISRKKIKKNKKITLINNDFKNIKKLPQCDFILYCLRTNSINADNRLFKLLRAKASAGSIRNASWYAVMASFL